VRLRGIAHPPVADRDVEQERLGIGTEAALLVQVLRGQQVGNGVRLVAEQRPPAAAQREPVGEEPVVVRGARGGDARIGLRQ
jgi:hypothetical protein